MAIKLDHTIVHSKDKQQAAVFLAELLGLPAPRPFAHFLGVRVGDTTLDYVDAGEHEIQVEHYAFLVGEGDFDAIFGRIREKGIDYWSDPGRTRKGEINRNDGGRGLYFEDPSGHVMEIITRPYGG